MLVEPGFFRTELLTPQSTQYAEPSIDDYADRTKQTVEAWRSMDGKQAGDPAKLAAALVQLAALDEPPVRFAAGADAVELFETKARTLLAQANAHRGTVRQPRARRRLRPLSHWSPAATPPSANCGSCPPTRNRPTAPSHHRRPT